MIRVAHVGNYSTNGVVGVDKTIVGLTQWLPRRGVISEVWHLSAGNREVTERTEDGVTIYELPSHRRPLDVVRRLPAATRAFTRTRAGAVDLVHFHSVFIPSNPRTAHTASSPYVVTPHGGYSDEVMSGRNRIAKSVWMKGLEKTYLERAAAIHAVSAPEADELRSMLPGARVVYIPNAIDLPPAHQPQPGERGKKRLLHLGRLAVDHKGLDMLLRGYARFVRSTGDAVDTELVLAGPDFRGGRAQLESLAGSLGILKQVVFTGPVFGDEKESLLNDSHAFVLTSRWEGLPFALLEAFAHELPVMITPQTNLAAEVESYQAGVVVSFNEESIADGVRRVCALSPGAYREMASGARRLVQELFTWSEVSRQMAELYNQILHAA